MLYLVCEQFSQPANSLSLVSGLPPPLTSLFRFPRCWMKWYNPHGLSRPETLYLYLPKSGRVIPRSK